jgi:hypothetical protein
MASRQSHEFGSTSNQGSCVMPKSGLISSALFEMCSEQILLPICEETRTKIGSDGATHSLLNRCSCHSCDGFMDECTRHRTILHLRPVHSRDQAQPLALGIFDLETSEARNLRLPQNQNSQVVKIVEMLDGLPQAKTRRSVVRDRRKQRQCDN